MVGIYSKIGIELTSVIESTGTFNVANGDRAPRVAQIRQAQATADGIEFVVIKDFFELPDTRPAPE